MSGFRPLGTQPVVYLAPELRERTPAQTGVVQELPTVLETYCLIADVGENDNLNILYHSDDGSQDSHWEKESVLAVSGYEGPSGEDDAWVISYTPGAGPSSGRNLSQVIAGNGSKFGLRISLLANNVSEVSKLIDIGIKNTESDEWLGIVSSRVLDGPGTVDREGFKYIADGYIEPGYFEEGGQTVARVEELSDVSWTTIEVIFDSALSGEDYYFTMYPGGIGNEDTSVATRVFRPHLQYEGYTVPQQKTGELNGPDGFELDDVRITLSNNGYASKDSDKIPDTAESLSHELFEGSLVSPYNIQIEMFRENDIGGSSVPGFGDVEIANPNGELDDLIRYSWTNRPIRIYFGTWSDRFEDFSMIFKGTCEGITWNLRTIRIRLRSLENQLNKPIQSELFGGFGPCVRGSDATGNRIDVGEHPNAFIKGDLTVEARCRFFSHTSTDHAGIASYGDDGSALESGNFVFDFRIQDAGPRFEYKHEYGAGTLFRFDSTGGTFPSDYFSDGEFHHVAFTRNSETGAIKFYLDGQFVEEGSYNISTESPTGGYLGDLKIGESGYSSSDMKNYDMDEVRIFNVVRNDEEIEENHNSEISNLTPGLVAYYKLNEGLLTTAFDEYSVTPTGEKINECVKFDLDLGYARGSSHADFNGSSLSWRFVFQAFKDPVAEGDRTYVYSRISHFQMFFGDSDGQLRVQVHDGGAFNSFSPGIAYEDGKWYYIDVTWNDTSQELIVYERGEEVGRKSIPISINLPSTVLRFAEATDDTSRGGVWISESAFFNTARQATEIADDWDAVLTTLEDGLVAYWLFDDGSGSTVSDLKNSHDLTLNGTTSWESTEGTLTGSISWVGSGEGGAEIAGKPKPIILGRVRHVPLTLVDPINLVYYTGYPPIESVESVMEGGNEKTLEGSSSDVWGENTGSWTGDYVVDNTHGLVRMKAAPTKPLTAHIKGDASGIGYRSDIANLVRKVSERYGELNYPPDFDDPAFDDMIIECPQEAGIYIGLSEKNMMEVMGEIMASKHGVWFENRVGKLSVVQLRNPDVSSSNFGITDNDIQVDSMDSLDTSDPTWRQRIGYGVKYHKFEQDQIDVAGVGNEEMSDLLQGILYSKSQSDIVKRRFRGSEDFSKETLLYSESDAKEEADERMILFGKDRDFYSVPLVRGFFTYNIGEIVEITASRLFLNGGRNFVIAGWSEDAVSKRVTLIVWG
jgi:hypothetical protein